MSEAYKKFTAQDYSVVPFNAHKQYTFNSSSADDNQIKWYNVSWTSESISLYSSASSQYGSDTINTVKYNQLDHLFYKNFKNDTLNRFGYNNYLIHKRELYKDAQILSIPAGLYGHEVKPGSFIVSSSNFQIVDDSHGNLMVSGTIVENFPSDIRKNIFKLGPVKGFKAYDLDTIPGYAVKLYDPQNKEEGITKRFWRRGVLNPNQTKYEAYTTPKETLSETDDSYYFNPFKYNNVNFTPHTFLNNNTTHPSIQFRSEISSHIEAPHDAQYNFNEEDFSISFYIKPEPLGYKIKTVDPRLNGPGIIGVGKAFGGGIVYHSDTEFIYIISTTPIGGNYPLNRETWQWGPLNVNAGNGVLNFNSGPLATARVGDGEQQTENIKISDYSNTDFIGGVISNFNHNGYDDWYIPTLTEAYTADINLEIFSSDGVNNPDFSELNTSLDQDSKGDFKFFNQLLTSTENDSSDINKYLVYEHNSLTGIKTDKNITTTGPAYKKWNGVTTTLPVRKIRVNRPGTWDTAARYIICKSGTQTIVPNNVNISTETLKNTTSLGTLQSKNIISQPQFPYEIYMRSHSLYFDRSDGDIISSVNCLLTGSSNYPEMHHVLCQKSSSKQEIYIDGVLQVSSLDTTIKQTQNLANLYIGSKGHQTTPDSNRNVTDTRFFNGSISNINIWHESFNSNVIRNISESINASPYVGNIFYQNGFAVLTRPNIQHVNLPSSKSKSKNIGLSTLTQRLNLKDYQDIPNRFITPLSINFDPDGTKMYVSTRQGYHKVGFYQFNINNITTNDTAFNLYEAGLNVDTTGNGAFLSGSLSDRNPISSSFANFSSSISNAFCSNQAFEVGNDGDSMFAVGNGWKNMSQSVVQDPRERYLGGIVEIPLGTAYDISSGSSGNGIHSYVNPSGITITEPGSMNFGAAKQANLSYVRYHSHIHGYLAQQNMTAAELTDQPHIIDENSSAFWVMGGRQPNTITWKKDGTRFWTTHVQEQQKTFTGPGNWKERVGPLEDPFKAGNLGTTFRLEEWYVETPWDIHTIKRSEKYVLGGRMQWGGVGFPTAYLGEVGTAIDATTQYQQNAYTGDVIHVGKYGTSLDLSTIISTDGYPIFIKDVHFNQAGTKMWILSNVTSKSEPLGTLYDAGGTMPTPLGAANNGSWIPFTNNDTQNEGAKMWEFNLTVPFDITSNEFVRTFNFASKNGILERAHHINDPYYAVGDSPHPSYAYNNSDGTSNLGDNHQYIRSAHWTPDGTTYFLGLAFGDHIVKVDMSNTAIPDFPPGSTNPKSSYKIQFQGSHMIWENEYQCTIDEHEFNDTLNISARKIKSQDSHELANFTTSSLFKPYITTVGLYNEENELLVVGKLGQPVMASNETDTTIVLRWDT